MGHDACARKGLELHTAPGLSTKNNTPNDQDAFLSERSYISWICDQPGNSIGFHITSKQMQNDFIKSDLDAMFTE